MNKENQIILEKLQETHSELIEVLEIISKLSSSFSVEPNSDLGKKLTEQIKLSVSEALTILSVFSEYKEHPSNEKMAENVKNTVEQFILSSKELSSLVKEYIKNYEFTTETNL